MSILATEALETQHAGTMPWVYEVPRLESDELVRARAGHFIGQIAAGAACEVVAEPAGETTSLMDAVKKAHEGDPAARKLVETNVRSDVIERTIKAGFVMKVQLQVNENGHVLQHGQTAQAIQANSLRFASGHPHMRKRVEAETRNMFRIEDALRRNLLDNYVFVVFSRAADTMSLNDMRKEGFFTNTMSMAIQATTLERGELTTETAFVAGKANRDAGRHDAQTLARLGERLGVDFAGKSDSEAIDVPVLIHKKYIPDGVINVVEWLDMVAGGTFFGQGKPRGDYLAYLEKCRERQTELEPTVQEITGKLISQSARIRTPQEATRLLAELSESHMLTRAVTDEQIDGMVFGPEAAFYLEGARHYHELGEVDKANELMTKALRVADSSSCPGGRAYTNNDEKSSVEGSNNKSNEDGDCEYISKKCPLCGKKNVKTVVKRVGNTRHISGNCGCSVVTKVPQRQYFTLAA